MDPHLHGAGAEVEAIQDAEVIYGMKSLGSFLVSI